MSTYTNPTRVADKLEEDKVVETVEDKLEEVADLEVAGLEVVGTFVVVALTLLSSLRLVKGTDLYSET